MSRFLVPLGVFGLLAGVLAAGIMHSGNKGIVLSPLLGKPAPAFELPDLADPGRTVHSASLRGHWYLFNVWGTWCGECRAEHEMLLKVRDSHQLPLVGLDWKDDSGQAQQWLKELGNPYSVVAVDSSGREAIEWGVYAAPESFLVNPQGVVVFKQTGALTEDAWQHEILPRIAPRAAGS